MDKQKLEQIKKEYKSYYDSFYYKGKFPVRSTKAGIWGITPIEPLLKFFEEFELSKFKNFLDLGSGDGCVVLLASQFVKSTGIELDKELFDKSIQIKEKLEIDCEFKNTDFFEEDFSKYDIIFINPDNRFSKGLDAKLKKEFKGILLVYGIVHAPNLLKKGKKYWLEQMPITVYENKK